MMVEPLKEHAWLQKFVGAWSYEGEAFMGPDQPRAKFTGRESVRSVGGLWIVAEGRGTMPGGGVGTALLTVGYDPQKERFVGSWVGSMMASMYVYEGRLDESGTVLTLEAEGPNCVDEGKTAKYRDIYEFKSADVRMLRSEMQGADGQWQEFVRAEYRRSSS
ncbi:MAG: DUF1579 domain-containing protein [Phycisphaerales bacterium]|nr:DUF1579 domain-containing protein [Phycisphaerales bacterium]